MTGGTSPRQERTPSLLQNWISLAGIVLAASALFAVACLLAIDLFRGFENPYMGVLTYLVAPGFLTAGLSLIGAGAFLERRRRRRYAPGEFPRFPRIDLNVPEQRNTFLVAAWLSFFFLLLTALGSYRTYHFTESVQFCGRTCHTVMKPEFTAYQNSPHARVSCVKCHIGPGAGWFVKSKLSGTYQVFATLADKFPRPIPTPIEDLRPARETCGQCHWPQKFHGSAERMSARFLADEKNSPWTIRLLMKVGGGDPEYGSVGGIHWHMNLDNAVEYIAADEKRQVIPWVRVRTRDGRTTVYEAEDGPPASERASSAKPRVMDCIDCHNRPSHNFTPPARAIDVALATGRIDPSIPNVKRLAVEALTGAYGSTEEARAAIARLVPTPAVAEVQRLYAQNFFPEMKVDWRVYPNNIGHTVFPGCFRCHDGKHKSGDGRVITRDCNACHSILSQGPKARSEPVNPAGLPFKHPVDIGEAWKEMNCTECHTGALAR